MLLVSMPGAVVFWVIIHPLIDFWRKRGAVAAYAVAFGAMLTIGIMLFLYRDALLGMDLGTHWLLFGIGLLMYVTTWIMERLLRRHLKFKTLVGVPEIKGQSTNMLDQGMYRLVRHPRYLAIMIGMFGWSFMCNYVGTYLLSALMIPGLLLIVFLEERELVSRFGDEYREYQKRVPRIVPTLSSFRAATGR